MQHFFAFCLGKGRLGILLLIAVFCSVLTGCGNKGPLYLPPEPVQEVSSTSDTANESEEPSTQSE